MRPRLMPNMCSIGIFSIEIKPKESNNHIRIKKEFICDTCASVTELDTSSVYELEKI